MSFSTIKTILTLNCEESTKLVSDSLDRRLKRSERLAVVLHGLGCWSCRRFRKQIELIRKAMRSGKAAAMDASLTPEARQRIESALNRTARKEL